MILMILVVQKKQEKMQVKLFLVKRLRAGFFEFQQLTSLLSEKLVIRETNDLSTICNWKLKNINRC